MKSLLAATALVLAGTPALAQNLVTNPGFESGNSGFTSDYSYQQLANTPFVTGGAAQYTVRQDANGWNGEWVGVARSGTGMFLANGSTNTSATVWEQTVTGIQANTKYFFEAWVMNTCCNGTYSGPNSPSILTFMIDGFTLGTRTTDLAHTGTWEGLSTNWFSGATSGSVTLRLVNAQPALGGNDFAIDDINLSTIATVPSAVPEPSAYAMALLGLGLMGVIARRRRV